MCLTVAYVAYSLVSGTYEGSGRTHTRKQRSNLSLVSCIPSAENATEQLTMF